METFQKYEIFFKCFCCLELTIFILVPSSQRKSNILKVGKFHLFLIELEASLKKKFILFFFKRRRLLRGSDWQRERGKGIQCWFCRGTLSPWVKTRRESEEKRRREETSARERGACVGLHVCWSKRSPNPPLARINAQGDIGQDTSRHKETWLSTLPPPFPTCLPPSMRFVAPFSLVDQWRFHLGDKFTVRIFCSSSLFFFSFSRRETESLCITRLNFNFFYRFIFYFCSLLSL